VYSGAVCKRANKSDFQSKTVSSHTCTRDNAIEECEYAKLCEQFELIVNT
jgi:hypothetical protein